MIVVSFPEEEVNLTSVTGLPFNHMWRAVLLNFRAYMCFIRLCLYKLHVRFVFFSASWMKYMDQVNLTGLLHYVIMCSR